MLLPIQPGPQGPGAGFVPGKPARGRRICLSSPMHLSIVITPIRREFVVLYLLTQGLSAAVPWAAAVVAAFTAYVGVALAVALFHPDPIHRGHAAQVLDRLLTALQFRRPR